MSYKGNKNATIADKIKDSNPIELVRSGELNMLHLKAAMFYKSMEVEDKIKKEKKDTNLNKDRHFWIYGEPNSGKTTWRENNLIDE